jgi:hypothetical protein
MAHAVNHNNQDLVTIHLSAGKGADPVFGLWTGPVDADYSCARSVVSFGDAPIDSGAPLVSVARRIEEMFIAVAMLWPSSSLVQDRAAPQRLYETAGAALWPSNPRCR